jgi:hypothetical protein
MTKRGVFLLLAASLMCAARTVVAQRAQFGRPDPPAVFRAEPCVATIVLDNRDAYLKPSSIARDEVFVLVDKRYRMPLTISPVGSRAGHAITFSPHDFLCDGKTHRVEVIRKGARPKSYQLTFPKLKRV